METAGADGMAAISARMERGDLFRKRQQLMEAWSRYCAHPVKTGDKVVALQRR